MERKYVYVTEMGYLFRMTERNFRKFLRARVEVDYDKCEELMGNNLGKIANVTDLSGEEAKEMLIDNNYARRPKPG